MKVYMDQFESYMYAMYNSDGEEIYIEVEEDFYNEYLEVEEKYEEMQEKLECLNVEYNTKLDVSRKERKIEALKKELKELEGRL